MRLARACGETTSPAPRAMSSGPPTAESEVRPRGRQRPDDELGAGRFGRQVHRDVAPPTVTSSQPPWGRGPAVKATAPAASTRVVAAVGDDGGAPSAAITPAGPSTATASAGFVASIRTTGSVPPTDTAALTATASAAGPGDGCAEGRDRQRRAVADPEPSGQLRRRADPTEGGGALRQLDRDVAPGGHGLDDERRTVSSRAHPFGLRVDALGDAVRRVVARLEAHRLRSSRTVTANGSATRAGPARRAAVRSVITTQAGAATIGTLIVPGARQLQHPGRGGQRIDVAEPAGRPS